MISDFVQEFSGVDLKAEGIVGKIINVAGFLY
jgi:hypothetical protein